MQELLLGYLLGALDDPDQEFVENRLETSSDWREEFFRLKDSIKPLAEDAGDASPPPGLAGRACRLVAWRSQSVLSPVSGDQVVIPGRSVGWSLADVAVAAGVFFAASLFFFPALNQSRHGALVQTCQNNLRQIISAAHRYSEAQAGFFPSVPEEGRFADAGIFPVRLFDAGFLADHSALICPGSNWAERSSEFRVPSMDELRAIPDWQLALVRNGMGGTYAYRIGYMNAGEYCRARDHRSPHLALATDAPYCRMTGAPSRHHSSSVGQPVGFEDGSVRMVASPEVILRTYRNDDGDVAAGLNQRDVVLAGSGCRPIPSGMWVRFHIRLKSKSQVPGLEPQFRPAGGSID